MTYDLSRIRLDHGDCLTVLRGLPDNSVDAIVTDPPYGLSNTDPQHVADTLRAWCGGDLGYTPPVSGGGFMGKTWDSFVPPPAVWQECLRVLKPGGHALVFAGSRTVDLMGMSLRLAGFDIRDQLQWLYGSGFPKSHDIGKAIDKAAGAEREIVGPSRSKGLALKPGRSTFVGGFTGERPPAPDETAPATPEAEQWQGWGTALKPAHEPIILARKPLRGTVAANVLAHGTGGLNIDGCRIDTNGEHLHTSTVPNDMRGGHYGSGHRPGEASAQRRYAERGGTNFAATPGPRGGDERGRWPANVVLDDEAAALLDQQAGPRKAGGRPGNTARTPKFTGTYSPWDGQQEGPRTELDSGGASRFFYVPKAAARERPTYTTEDGRKVAHPTVKPLALMRWLCRLVTPPGGLVLDPFAGSGTTAEAAILEDLGVHAIEADADYLPLILERIIRATTGGATQTVA